MRAAFARLTITAAILALAPVSCTDSFEDEPSGKSDASFSDATDICADPNADEDGDGIPNGDEGCLSGRDSDGDKVPDWQDYDSDDDGIYDDLERGKKTSEGTCESTDPPKDNWPCDSDGDKVPDFLDLDSDNDGIQDKDEDANGDGLVGCCLGACDQPMGKQKQECILTDDGCGPGQTCEGGACKPGVAFECSNGETNPLKKDTFGDGKLDNERGTFICRDATEDRPEGRKAVLQRTSGPGDWQVALEKSAKYGELKITAADPKMAAAVIDLDDVLAEVSGFVLSRDTAVENVQDELTTLLQAVAAKVPGGSGTVSVRASGTQVKSHDRYDSIQGTILDVTLSTASNVSTVRNELVGTLLGKPMAELNNLPSPYGSSHTDFVIRFVTLKRVEFAKDKQGNLVKDAEGYPVDGGDQSKWRVMVMGAVAGKPNYQDPQRDTGILVEDLSNGTGLARFNDEVFNECDVGTISSLPVADIIWVVDESGSMNDNRQDIVNNANNFFSRALSSGLDFRMGVTNVCTPTGSYKNIVGKFCSKVSTSTSDDGGVDRFLLPSEQTIFSSCIKNPPGYEGGSEYGIVNAREAVKKHLPRASTPDKIRPEAKLVIIVATDEFPNSLTSAIGSSNYKTCTLPASNQQNVDQALADDLALFTGATDPEAATMFHVIGGVCNNSCGAQVAHGYKELAQKLGGQIGDVCQKDLGNTLQVIIDSIVGAASPVKLEYIPISASLAVAMDGTQIQRSRANGFDYRSANNSLAFINVAYKKGSEIIASYKRWRQGIVVK